MTNEELIQEDLPEVIKVWMIIKKMKDRGNGELNIVIRDSTIVNVKQTELWVHKGTPFESCTID